LANIREAVELHVEDLIDAGGFIPEDPQDGTMVMPTPPWSSPLRDAPPCHHKRASSSVPSLKRLSLWVNVVVAYHGLGETFPAGTLRAMIADAGLISVA